MSTHTINGSEPAAIITKAPERLVIAEHMDIAAAVEQVRAGERAVNDRVVESASYIGAIFRGALSSTHVGAFGPGGGGKTMGATNAAEVLGLTSAYTVFRNDMKREELFGPLSMKGIVERDVHEHVMNQGYAQDVEHFLGDEFADGARFLRQLLNLLNERWFVNGNTRYDTPLVTATFMANFWPNDPVLDALMDRITQRVIVDGKLSSEGFKSVLRANVRRAAERARGNHNPDPLPTIARTALATAMFATQVCNVPDSIVDTIEDVRRAGEVEGLIDRSPRRWSQAVSLAQANAVLRGSDTVTEADLSVLALVLPNSEDEMTVAATLVAGFRDPVEQWVDTLADAVGAVEQLLNSTRDEHGMTNYANVTEGMAKIERLQADVTAKRSEFAGRDMSALDLLSTTLADQKLTFLKAIGVTP